jgi:hypothetical protein
MELWYLDGAWPYAGGVSEGATPTIGLPAPNRELKEPNSTEGPRCGLIGTG